MGGWKAWVTTALLGLSACEQSPFREVHVDIRPVQAEVLPLARPATATTKPFRVSVAGMESPSGTYAAWSRLFGEVAHRLGGGMELEFVQRRTYAEVNELLMKGELDAALLCTGGYLELQRRDPGAVEVVAVPIINGSDAYQSLIIVPASSQAQSLRQLEGRRFAFTDELSLTGRAWVVHELRAQGKTPETFFGATSFTRSHDRSVSAVARGVVDGASVHSIVFQHLLEKDPALLDKVRVIQRSPEFGMTPVVASQKLSRGTRAGLREVLLELSEDPEGAALLSSLRINRFALALPGLFDSAYDVVQPAP
ncbi:MAG: PhnD/SsuA/transferrin family substrate-binding protein [Archangium sp.]|nr:PhnD/SsuA/transferrin family substrate-binding protein [Archangium sp.]